MIRTKTKKIINKLVKKYDLKTVMLFGSQARKTSTQKSDIDIAILPAAGDFYEKRLSDFSYDLMEAEEAEKKDIDIVPISNFNPILLYHIFHDGTPIYIKDQEEYCRLRSWARFSYEDNQKFFKGREKILEKRLAEI